MVVSTGSERAIWCRTGQVSFFSIFQIITPNFLFSRDLFKMAPSLMFRMETS